MTMEMGDGVPAVRLTGSDGSEFDLPQAVGPGGLVIYFYPKADTTGCTREAQDFTALAEDFAAAGVAVIGVSRDTPAKLRRFADKYALGVTLASDGDGHVCEAFGTWVEKQMYGRSYFGIERATFAFDGQGRLVRTWRKVKVPGHAAAVLGAVRGEG